MSNQNTGPGFSNIQGVPTVAQPAQPAVPQRVGFNRNYLLSVTGILRLVLILFQFAAWVSAAAVKKGYDLPGEIDASRSAYLFFSIVGFIIALFLFLLNVLNIVSLGFFNRLPWGFITLITNLLWIIPTFVLAIVAAVRETDVKNNYSEIANVGAFGSAAFFGFVNTIIYAADAGYHLLNIVRGGINAPPSYNP